MSAATTAWVCRMCGAQQPDAPAVFNPFRFVCPDCERAATEDPRRRLADARTAPETLRSAVLYDTLGTLWFFMLGYGRDELYMLAPIVEAA